MASNPFRLRLTREEIARIVGNDQNAIRQFERLFSVADRAETDTTVIQALVEQVATGPVDPWLERWPVETIDWRTFPRYVPQTGRMGWEPVYGTVGVGMAGNTMHRLGLNSFVRVINNTGSAIPAGRVVAATTVDASGWPQAVPYLANGATPASAVLGILAETLAIGALGYACSYGPIMDLDTSAFAAGVTIYASSTVAGAWVTAQPAAPNIVLPLGNVSVVSATEGVIVSRLHQMGLPELPAVAAPVGGATVDAEARTAISALIGRLQQSGLLA